MAVMNLGMGSPVAWSPERQTSQTVYTPADKWQQMQAIRRPSHNSEGYEPMSGDPVAPGQADLIALLKAGGDPAMANRTALIDDYNSGKQPIDLPQLGDWLARYNAAPAGSTLPQAQALADRRASNTAFDASQRSGYDNWLQQTNQAQSLYQNAYGQQTGFGVQGGILPRTFGPMQTAPRPQPQASQDRLTGAQAFGSFGAMFPSDPNWRAPDPGPGVPPTPVTQGYGQPGGLGGLGGQPPQPQQPSESLGGPFAQRNPWGLA